MEVLAPEDLVDEWSDLSASSLGSGARLGRYELLIPIAYGGMARVWAARLHGQRGFSKTVAIKTILPHLAHNPEFERMFLDEARIAAGVHHPNVTEIYELGEEGHVLYLVMEWVNGDSLMHVLRAGEKQCSPIAPRISARLIADACAGLHAAHELVDEDGRLMNVVHRDVSPHNILVSLEGTVKVTDFGVAKALGQSHQATTAGQVKGKVAYMAPEQIGGTEFDRRADIFGMGCVLYEAVTGQQPFRGGGDPQIMQAVLRGTYEPPSSLVKGFPGELERIIDQALAPEPRARFATAESMRVTIEEWLAKSGSIITATQTGGLVRQRLGPALDRRRELVKAAMASLQPEGAPRPGAGNTPSAPQPGQSHSGVMSTGASAQGVPASDPMRPRAPSLPQVPPPLPPRVQPPVQATQPMPIVAAAPSGARYLVAAAGGVIFALLVGGITVGLWMRAQPGAGDVGVTQPAPGTRPATVASAATASAMVVPVPPSPAVSPVPVASAAHDLPSPVPTISAATIDVSDLPTAKPTWQPGPAVQAPAVAPHPSAAAPASPALPANPY